MLRDVSTRPTTRDWLLFGLISLFWGSSYLFIKIGVETLQPFTLIAGRLFFGSLVLGVALIVVRAPLPRDRVTYAKLVFMAIFNIVVPFSLITWGEQYIDSSLAAILQATTPLFTIVIASLALAEEAITVKRLVGLIIGFGGVVVLFSHGQSGGRGDSLQGEIALVLSSLSYAVGNVFVRVRMRGFHPTVPAFFQVSIAFVMISVMVLLFESPIRLPGDARAWFAVIWLGVFGSSLAYLIYFRLVHVLGATRLSLITYLMPIVGIVLGLLVLNETIDIRTVVGAAIILAGVGLVNSRRPSRTLYGRSAPGDDGRPPAEGVSQGDDGRPRVGSLTES
jgi:drug/metabolite transporter (DMT)-like permease